ncbi:hypothetical protein [Paraglaciecola sp. L3A3]|uniref:hypothetical protein n=1 Tax=Paraglaciecola sp. L3A3 TaxID=2686358 RepID=UPI00131C89FD|nr:hypothetical protein [Paraglaciecola sp. L3A3]
MSLDNPKGIESSVSNNTKQRRTFLKRASAGAVIASIPGRSAWATIAGSVVASGHGSNNIPSTSVAPIALLSHGFWKQRLHPTRNNGRRGSHRADNVAFNSVFTASSITDTFYEVLTGSQDNVHFQMVAMYLNAKYHGTLGINYPVVYNAYYSEATNAAYPDLDAFAQQLWSLSLTNSNFGSELDDLINNNHAY